jgi:hypothetical protein
MIILVLSVPKTSESYDEVAAGHKTRRYVGSLGFRTGRICLFSQRNDVWRDAAFMPARKNLPIFDFRKPGNIQWSKATKVLQ